MNSKSEQWRAGCGVIQHDGVTCERVTQLVLRLEQKGLCNAETAWALFLAADRLTSMGLWLTAHMTYARQVYLDGRTMAPEDFKGVPEGDTGGARNVVPA